MSDNLIGITGANGEIGKRVAKLLAKNGIQQRLFARDTTKVSQVQGAEIVQYAGYSDTANMEKVFSGVDTLFLVSGHLSDDRVQDHKNAVSAAKNAGVKHIVYLSFLNASPNAVFLAAREHFHTEEYIRASGIDFTFLRCGLYADLVPLRFVEEDATLRAPAGNGKASYVTRDDIASAAAVVLSGTGHVGKTYDFTGSEAITMNDVAEMLTEFSGRQCTYYAETIEEAKQSRAIYNATDEMVAFWISSYTSIAAGEMATISDDIENLIGHPQTTFRDFLTNHPEVYQHLSTDK